MLKPTLRIIVITLFLAVLASGAVAQKKRHRVSAWGVPEIYSNLALEPETGDVGGMEVIITPVYGGEWATVVIASGVANDPVLVRVERVGMNIEFTLPKDDPGAPGSKFTGKITRAGLILSNEGFGHQLLKRQYR